MEIPTAYEWKHIRHTRNTYGISVEIPRTAWAVAWTYTTIHYRLSFINLFGLGIAITVAVGSGSGFGLGLVMVVVILRGGLPGPDGVTLHLPPG